MLPRDDRRATTPIQRPKAEAAGGQAGVAHQDSVTNFSGTVTSGPDIGLLTRAVKRGEAAAFSDLYDLFAFRLYKYLLVLARGNEADAREVCQAVFIKLAKRCDAFEDEGKFWAWLRVLGRNALVDHWRARQRRDWLVSFDELIPEPGHPAPEERLGEILREILAALPADERELLEAVYVDNRPIRELAEEFSQTYKAVESRLGRLRQKVKEKLIKDLHHETRV